MGASEKHKTFDQLGKELEKTEKLYYKEQATAL